jgi:hypothetical protein
MDSGGIVFKVAIFALIGLALYYFYKWLNGSDELTDVVLYTSALNGLPANQTNKTEFTPTNSDIPMLFAGGEYSISTWIYINNWTENRGHNKPFLTLGGGGSYITTILYLGQHVPKLGIRTSTSTDSNFISSTTLSSVSLTPSQLLLIRPTATSATTPYSDASTDFKLCDVESVDLQRWVNITVVLSGRTQDVYIDGKMSRSCVLPNIYQVAGDVPTIKLGGAHSFGGFIGTTKAANFAYSPDQVYKNYLNGPLDTSIWTKIKSYFDPSQYSFTIQKNGSNIVSAST